MFIGDNVSTQEYATAHVSFLFHIHTSNANIGLYHIFKIKNSLIPLSGTRNCVKIGIQ